MNENRNNDGFIDVESTYTNEGEQMSWNNYFQGEDNNKKKSKKRKGKVVGVIAGGLVVAMIGGAFGSAVTYKMMKSNAPLASNTQINYVPQSFSTSSGDELSAADAFNKVSPAVVIVSTKSLTSSMFGGSQEVEGIGSGFIINEEGYVLTNYHVIQGAQEVTVTLSDEQEINATVVNYDEDKDIAMLKLAEGTKVPAVAELGDSDEIYPGAEVIAIGTPLSKNFAHTLTKGVISGSNRTIEGENGTNVNLIQTDAAINPGNSGGPLVNTRGQVIGINSMKIGSQVGQTSVEGIGFAIPINEVKNKIESLSKPILNLGIQIRAITEDLSKKYDFPEGIYIAGVEEFSPAEKAGLKIGDIIVKCDGKEIKTTDELKAAKEGKDPGDVLKLQVVRNKKTIDIDVTLEEK